ncbi:hypothetical protein COM18_09690 [Bacillus pseudomycoides]|nr:hypothetical protein COM18_09690 [Bacillus pseudomycoides]
MTGKRHDNLVRDIDSYVEVLLNAKLRSANFFVESSYQDSTGRTNKSYLLTRKGCALLILVMKAFFKSCHTFCMLYRRRSFLNWLAFEIGTRKMP